MRDINNIKCTYAENAALHGKMSEEGNDELANTAHDAVVDAYCELQSHGDEGMNALLTLMDHKNDSVRCWAATHSLTTADEKAVAVLREIADGVGAVSFTAEMVLSEWKKGTLEIPGKR